jgi:hypothetical protein
MRLVPGDVIQWSPTHEGLVLGPLYKQPTHLLFLEVQREHAQLRPVLATTAMPRMPVGTAALQVAQRLVAQEATLLRQARAEADLRHLAGQFALPQEPRAPAAAPAAVPRAPAAAPRAPAAAPPAAAPRAPQLAFPPLLGLLGRSAAGAGPIGPGIL